MTVVVTHTTPADGSFSATGAAAWNANHTLSGVGTMAEQNANNVAITGGSVDNTTVGAATASTGAFTTLSASSTVSGAGFSTYLASPPAIGGTAAAAGTFTTLIGGNDVANYGQLTGGATTKAVEFKSLGSDTNVAYAIRPKGTGAIDLAAGSSGVNISNGGTVTALTRTASGSGYTSFPSIAISAPTTAGGVQAVGTISSMGANSATVQAGGTGYTNGDVLTLVGGTPSSVAATFTVNGVSGGVITSVSSTNFATYSVLPTNPVSVTGGTGTGATLNVAYYVNSVLNVSNAGSGYVEQPTVTFSGGGGSGAAAYATVGSQTIIKGLGTSTGTQTNQSIMFQTPAGNALLIRDAGNAVDAHVLIQGTGNGYGFISGDGTNANASLILGAKAAGTVRFTTNGTSLTEQMRVTHTASAVNYVQVTGGATGAGVVISSQGSDASVNLGLQAKSGGVIRFFTGNGTENFRVGSVSSTVNYITANGSIAGASPSFVATGSDTDIDLTLTPKGAGAVRFGTYTAGVLTPTGYITVKTSDGTTRRLLVG